ncbi:MAG: circadian clock protein KaiA [Oscillatoriaceae bacterium SKW80]|nr:circadian clock protein KaiA [Oscillatoriaceae bacterium SKYG93]MCX8120267.1 circadian clock protein KaiA [Oscillatoriaceae bacterium SKW80]MDW8453193.1 circadian clock protein KaiA [Oscillatoriaceae cyanobacterium SKYGB_i_bin93]HIK28895.1 circadian clock protein KaiA [Oscillatoriaceae cyanobacterium M7585_C2015_266]
MRTQLSICIFLRDPQLAESIAGLLASARYCVTSCKSPTEFVQFVEREKQQLDCLILENDPDGVEVANQLRQENTLLPAVILNFPSPRYSEAELQKFPSTLIPEITPPPPQSAVGTKKTNCLYHPAEVQVSSFQLSQIPAYIDRALAEFLNLSPSGNLPNRSVEAKTPQELSIQHFLLQQQRRLAEKLKERLGYLGVYYKRNPQRFLRHLPPPERKEFLENLKAEYREIILNYFSKDESINQKIDDFVNQAFFADLPVTNIVEIHMELMDEFAKQLKLEGRSEEVLLDYRLTLIDTIAHLCEMYRRSIPRDS